MVTQKINLLILGTAITLMASTLHAAPGSYVGLSLGEASNFSDKNLSRSFRGMPITAAFGYIAMLRPYIYLGGEVFGVMANISLDNNGLRSLHGYGVSVMPAIMIADHTLAFIRAGVVRTTFKPQNIKSQLQTGTQFGVGLQFSVALNIDLRTEYVYSAYKSFAGIMNPSQDAYSFAIIYKF